MFGGAAEPPVNEVDLYQVPLTRPNRDVILVSEDDLAGRGVHQVAYVRVAVDESWRPGKVLANSRIFGGNLAAWMRIPAARVTGY